MKRFKQWLGALALTGLAACAGVGVVTPPPAVPTPPPVVEVCEPGQLIVQVYAELLERAPDAYGIEYYSERLCDGRMNEESFRADVMASAEYAALHTVSPPQTDLQVKWPAVGASYYTLATDPDVDVEYFAHELEQVGVTFTRFWLLDAWALGERGDDGKFLPGQYEGYLPVKRAEPFDLYDWSEAYFRHLRAVVDTLNTHQIWPQITILDLYTWSDRKAKNKWVPSVDKQPYRFNINGVRWGNPDDPTFETLPDAWLSAFICKVVSTLDGSAWVPEIGNEMPEKEMHERILRALRECGWEGEVTINRNEDTPGQYWNMRIGDLYDRIALHNLLDISYLDVEYPDEAPAGRPTTFRKMWEQVEPNRVIISSDGSGGNPDYLSNLKEVACDALLRGASYEHQLAIKRNRFWGDGSLRMSDLSIDTGFLESLQSCESVVGPPPPPTPIPEPQVVDAYEDLPHMEFPGGWYAAALPSGEFAVLMEDGSGVVTHLGFIPTLDKAHAPLYPVIAKEPFRIAGQGWEVSGLIQWEDGLWSTDTSKVPCGVYPLIWVAGTLEGTYDCGIGSQGYRFVSPSTGLPVTGDATYGPSAQAPGLYEWTDLGDGLFVGQGDPEGAIIWDGTTHRSLAAGNVRFIHGSCEANLCAIAAWRPYRPSLIVWATKDQLRNRPVVK